VPQCHHPAAPGSNLSDNINLGILQHLESAFLSADSDGSGQLSMDEFVAAFTGDTAAAATSERMAPAELCHPLAGQHMIGVGHCTWCDSASPALLQLTKLYQQSFNSS